MDPLDISINTTRGSAMHAVIQYALIQYALKEILEKIIQKLKQKVEYPIPHR